MAPKENQKSARFAGKVFAWRKRAGTLRWGQRQGGVFRLPPPCLWTPPTPQRERGCSPLSTPKEKSKRKNASRFAKTGCGAQRPLRALSGTRVLLTAAPTAPPCIRRWRRSSPLHFFRASPIDRPLSRCGGSSPQGSGGALSVTFGDTLSPFCRCATSSPDRGKSFKGRGKKHSHYALGTLSKEYQETFPPRSWLSLRESWREAPERVRSPAGSQRQQMLFSVTTPPVKK